MTLTQSSLFVLDVSLLAPEGCSRKDFSPFWGSEHHQCCGEASVSLRGAALSDIQDFPRPQPQPPLGTPFTFAPDAFLAPNALIPEPIAALELRLFPRCGIPMKTPHITPSPPSGEEDNTDVDVIGESLVIFPLPTHTSDLAPVVLRTA